MPRKESVTAQPSAQAQQEAASDGIENYELPKSLVTRIAKSALPDNAKLQKDTVLALVKGSTVFINYLAATAHDIATSRQHKSVSASDVLKALEHIQFGDMVEGLQEELDIYRELTKNAKKGKGASAAGGGGGKGKGKERAVSPAQLAASSISGSGTQAPADTVDIDEDAEMADEAGDEDAAQDQIAEDDDPEDMEGETEDVEEDELAGDVDGEEDEGGGAEEDDQMLLEEEKIKHDSQMADLGEIVEAPL